MEERRREVAQMLAQGRSETFMVKPSLLAQEYVEKDENLK